MIKKGIRKRDGSGRGVGANYGRGCNTPTGKNRRWIKNMLTEENENKKGLTINVTLGQTITVILIVCIAFAGGLLLNQPTEQVQLEQVQCPQYAGFTEKDLNILGNLAYASGECERQGFASAIIPQQTDNNEVYGISVCIERTGGE